MTKLRGHSCVPYGTMDNAPTASAVSTFAMRNSVVILSLLLLDALSSTCRSTCASSQADERLRIRHHHHNESEQTIVRMVTGRPERL